MKIKHHRLRLDGELDGEGGTCRLELQGLYFVVSVNINRVKTLTSAATQGICLLLVEYSISS